MLARTLVIFAIAAAAATQVPALVQRFNGDASTATDTVTPAADPAAVTASGSGIVSIKLGSDGHYNSAFRLNGKSIDALIDTGASLVAINETTARRIGISASSLDFKYKMNTANGQTEAAMVILDRVEVGSIRVRDVQAIVMRDQSLTATLIGMSFMNKLNAYRVENDTMKLQQ